MHAFVSIIIIIIIIKIIVIEIDAASDLQGHRIVHFDFAPESAVRTYNGMQSDALNCMFLVMTSHVCVLLK